VVKIIATNLKSSILDSCPGVTLKKWLIKKFIEAAALIKR